MNKQLTETSFLRKPYSNPQLKVVKLAGADVISTSGPFKIEGQKFEEEDW